ncbi:MAG: tRNA dihydrouridine synthase DusB [Alphaproteobacteria bacterium]|nr:tRNA dihydrouridine synthase DusB [Alphaproteobacteria bacterium]
MAYQIGNVQLDSNVMLAPMAGVTDMPFRRLVKSFGVGLVVSEMIASKAMIHANKKTLRMSTGCDDEFPMSVQLAGTDPDDVAEAAKLNEDRGAAIIDLNMGCPAKKVVNGYSGSALMKDECLAGRIMEAAVKAVRLPVTLKMRTGWDDDNRNAPTLARIAEESGIQSIVVHGRTRQQFYKGRADWDFIGEVKRSVSIPVTGNGDVNTVDDAADLLRRSGADGVMIGRGTYGRPWFPSQVAHFLATGERLPDPDLEIQMRTILDHYDAMRGHYGNDLGMRNARKHIGWYSKGLPSSAEFRAGVFACNDPDGVPDLVRAYFHPLIERAA